MNIKEVPHGLEINVHPYDYIDFFIKKALKEKGIKKPYKYSTAYANSFRIDVTLIEIPTKSFEKKRKNMLERAKKIKLLDFIEEFRSTATKENQRMISQFCNVFTGIDWKEHTLEFLIENGKEQILLYRRVGKNALDLFEKFLNSKKFEFATWNGEKWI